jgi:hypothetical protein
VPVRGARCHFRSPFSLACAVVEGEQGIWAGPIFTQVSQLLHKTFIEVCYNRIAQGLVKVSEATGQRGNEGPSMSDVVG